VLNDPVIGSVEPAFDNHEFAPVLMGNANPRVGDHCDMESVSLRHAINFLLHGAGIGIDEYFKHLGSFPQSANCTQLLALETAYASTQLYQLREHSGTKLLWIRHTQRIKEMTWDTVRL